jgi:hypothetical protein
MINYKQMTKDNILKIYGREPTTLDELGDCVRMVASTHCERRLEKRNKLVVSPPTTVIGLAWDIRYTDHVSNTHSEPINGLSNFSQDDDKPKHYPGFTGRVWIRYKNEEGYTFGSDPMRITCTHTGTGGIGGYGGPWEKVMHQRFARHRHAEADFPRVMAYSWDYRIYLDDWPALKDVVEKHRTWCTLSNKNFSMQHKYQWEDAATLARDHEFMNEEATKRGIARYNELIK